MEALTVTPYDSPIGTLYIGGKENKLHFICHENNRTNRFNHSTYTLDNHAFNEAKKQLDDYFKGDLTTFSFNYHLNGTDFQKKVWKKLTEVPYGETRTYKELAEMIGHPKAYRAVGGALNKNPLLIMIPCHRIVGSQGDLTGFAGGLDQKQYLLQLESTF